MRLWPEGARSAREEAIMPTVDLILRLARDAKPQTRDTFLFDRPLPGFGLRIHASGRKVWIVQGRIDGRSRRIDVARFGEMELAEARRRAHDLLARTALPFASSRRTLPRVRLMPATRRSTPFPTPSTRANSDSPRFASRARLVSSWVRASAQAK